MIENLIGKNKKKPFHISSGKNKKEKNSDSIFSEFFEIVPPQNKGGKPNILNEMQFQPKNFLTNKVFFFFSSQK